MKKSHQINFFLKNNKNINVISSSLNSTLNKNKKLQTQYV